METPKLWKLVSSRRNERRDVKHVTDLNDKIERFLIKHPSQDRKGFRVHKFYVTICSHCRIDDVTINSVKQNALCSRRQILIFVGLETGKYLMSPLGSYNLFPHTHRLDIFSWMHEPRRDQLKAIVSIVCKSRWKKKRK